MDARSFPKESPGGDAGYCGDGYVGRFEECEPGADVPVTCDRFGYATGVLGCSPLCTFTYEDCGPSVCANGVIESGEACEFRPEGGLQCRDADDCRGCNNNCQTAVTVECGNGTIEPPEEECDGDLFRRSFERSGTRISLSEYDTDTVSCWSNCIVNLTEAFPATCGNRIREGGEECETHQSPRVNADGETERCLQCRWGTGEFTCGDGVLQPETEACDGGQFAEDFRECSRYSNGTAGLFTSDTLVTCTSACTIDLRPCRAAEEALRDDAGHSEDRDGTGQLDAGSDIRENSIDAGTSSQDGDVGCSTARAIAPNAVPTAALLYLLLVRRRRARRQ